MAAMKMQDENDSLWNYHYFKNVDETLKRQSSTMNCTMFVMCLPFRQCFNLNYSNRSHFDQQSIENQQNYAAIFSLSAYAFISNIPMGHLNTVRDRRRTGSDSRSQTITITLKNILCSSAKRNVFGVAVSRSYHSTWYVTYSTRALFSE